MSNRTRSIARQAKPKQDIEALAAKAREAREKKCSDAVNKALEDHNCRMSIEVQLGNSVAPLPQVLNLPVFVRIGSK